MLRDQTANREVAGQTTALLYRNALLCQNFNGVVTLMMAVVGYRYRPGFVLVWCPVMLAILLARAIIALRYKASTRKADYKWQTIWVVGSTVTGLAWAACAGALIWQAPTDLQFFVSFLVCCLVAVAVPSLAAVPKAFRLFSAPMVIAVIVGMGLQATTSAQWSVFVAMVIFSLVMLKSSGIFFNVIEKTITLGLEQTRLADDFRRRTEDQESALAALATTRGELETILRNAWIGVLQLAADRTILRVNRHFEEVMFGYSPGEMLGNKSRILYPSQEAFEETGRRAYPALSEGKPYSELEVLFQRKDGTTFLAQIVGSRTDPNDPKKGSIWLFSDITEKKAAEERLARTLAELEIIFQNASIGVVYLLFRRVVRVNKTFETMFGYSAAELIGQSTRFLYESDAAFEDAGRKIYSALDAGAKTYRFDIAAHRKDGGDLIVELVGSMVDPNDPQKGSIWLFSDVTELRRAQEELRVAKEEAERAADAIRVKSEQVARLLDNSGQGFLSFGNSLVVEGAYSRACERMLGFSPADRQADELLFPDDAAVRSLMRDCVADAMAESDNDSKSLFLSLIPPEIRVGSKILSANYIPIENGIMAVLSDVTEARALEQRVARESRRLEMIVSAVTDSVDFFAVIEEFRGFIEGGAAAWKNCDPASVYRAIHTFKGTFNQFGYYHVPAGLHEVEALLQEELGRESGEKAIAAVFAINNWAQLLDQDLATVTNALGKEFIARQGVVTLSPDEARRFEQLAARLLKKPFYYDAQDRAILAQLFSIRSVSLRSELIHFDRLIHRVAIRLEKEVAPLVVEGEDVRLDTDTFSPFLRSLGHLFRNAVDHGIESPDVRFAAGKSEHGTITCRISRSSGILKLEISDDGGGIDEAALYRHAVQLAPHRAAGWSLVDMVFTDGLSSRDVVTDLSGRGIGMAAVRAEVVRLGGTIDVASVPKQGTTFTFRIPFADHWRAN